MKKSEKTQSWVEQINKTKFFPPAAVKQVRRNAFIAKMNDSSQGSLLLVHAPAGYGKSSAVGQWFNDASKKYPECVYAWLSIDGLDNNFKRFLFHFAACFNTVNPLFGSNILGHLNVPGRLSLSALSATIVSALAEFDEMITLVLEDFHLITNPDFIKFMGLLAEQSPANFKLVIISRMPLPFGTSRLKACDQFFEVEVDDLRFDYQETEGFIRLETGLSLPADIVLSLVMKTEGWVAGLKFTALSIKHQDDANAFIKSFSGSNRDIAGFLAEEVFNHLPVRVQQFLLKTSVLDSMCPALCQHVTGFDDAGEMVDDLKKAGLFIITLDAEDEWCRYHHLFGEFLLKRLEASKNTSKKELYASASDWFLRAGSEDEAIKYSLLAEDVKRGLNILERASDQMFFDGKLNTLVHWVEHIGDVYLNNSPGILLNYIWILILEWRFLSAEKLLNKVRALLNDKNFLQGDPDGKQKFSMLLAHREMMYTQIVDDMMGVIDRANFILKNNSFSDPYLAGNVYTSLMYAEREYMDVHNVFEYDVKSRELYQASGSTFVLIWHGSIMAPALFFSGDVNKAKTVLEEAFSYAVGISGEISPLAAMPALLLAQIKFEQNDISACEEILDKYLPLADKIGFVDQLMASFITKARILVINGKQLEAMKVLQKAEQLSVGYNFSRLQIAVYAEIVNISCKSSDKKIAKAYLKKLEDLVGNLNSKPEKNVRTIHAMAALAKSRYLRLDSKYTEAAQLSKVWAQFCKSRNCVMQYLLFSMSLIAGYYAEGDSRRAIRILKDLLEDPTSYEFVNSFLAEGAIAIKLLKDIAMDNTEDSVKRVAVERAEHILSSQGFALKLEDAVIAIEPAEFGLQEPLNKQELVVLKMLEEGRSNKEIANQLTLKEGTVKWLLQSIYDKLGVRRRGRAVIIAKELGLIT